MTLIKKGRPRQLPSIDRIEAMLEEEWTMTDIAQEYGVSVSAVSQAISRAQEMERVGVVSGNLLSVGYDPDTKELEVEFHTGAIYRYKDVPAYVFDDLMGSYIKSKGQYFEKAVKGAGYKYRRVR